MRDLSPDFLAAVTSSEVSPAILVELDLLPTPLRVWTGVGTLTWNSQTWLGVGALGALEPIEEYSDIRAGSLRLSLNSIPSENLAEVRDVTFKRRAAEIFLATFSGDSRTLIGVQTLFRGTMDTMSISRGAYSAVNLTLANELSRLKDTSGTLYTDPHQQALHPGDTSLRFVASLQDRTIRF